MNSRSSSSSLVEPRESRTHPPPLENGARLARPEFERRYRAMPELKKAELVEGVVFMPSPVRQPDHSLPHAAVLGWLTQYWAATPGTEPGDNATVRLDLDNEPQPDALLRRQSGGSSRVGTEGYIEGPPELIVEIAASSESMDLHAKKETYRRSGVAEYLVWQVLERKLSWFVLREGRYDELLPDGDGVLRSEAFPGLWLEPAALLELDLPRALHCLRQGLASEQHAAFLTQLAGGR
jgi:Uma2 family endonuclease